MLEGRIRDDEVECVVGKWQWRGWIDDDCFVNGRIAGHNRIDVYPDDMPSFASQVSEAFPIRRRILVIGSAPSGAEIENNLVGTQQCVHPLIELYCTVAT